MNYRYTFLIATFAWSISASAGPIDRYAGFYSVPSSQCSDNQYKSCRTKFKDCLKITKISETEATVEILSIQAMQHVCSLVAATHFDGKALITKPPVNEPPEENPIVIFKLGSSAIEINYLAPPSPYYKYCGAHASLEGLKFPLNARRKAATTCTEE